MRDYTIEIIGYCLLNLFVCLIVLLMSAGCQTASKTEYYENGQIKSVEKREGFPNFSENKNFNLKR